MVELTSHRQELARKVSCTGGTKLQSPGAVPPTQVSQGGRRGHLQASLQKQPTLHSVQLAVLPKKRAVKDQALDKAKGFREPLQKEEARVLRNKKKSRYLSKSHLKALRVEYLTLGMEHSLEGRGFPQRSNLKDFFFSELIRGLEPSLLSRRTRVRCQHRHWGFTPRFHALSGYLHAHGTHKFVQARIYL